ncbi:unnamed protein product, partial [Clonostachys rhizophaga]
PHDPVDFEIRKSPSSALELPVFKQSKQFPKSKSRLRRWNQFALSIPRLFNISKKRRTVSFTLQTPGRLSADSRRAQSFFGKSRTPS